MLRHAFPDAAPGWIVGGKLKVKNPIFYYDAGGLASVSFRTTKNRFLTPEEVLRG